jgi:hypothetical protein
MTSQLPTTERFSYNRVNWPQEPMVLWRKIGIALAISMLLALVALASVATSSSGQTSIFSEQGPYP